MWPGSLENASFQSIFSKKISIFEIQLHWANLDRKNDFFQNFFFAINSSKHGFYDAQVWLVRCVNCTNYDFFKKMLKFWSSNFDDLEILDNLDEQKSEHLTKSAKTSTYIIPSFKKFCPSCKKLSKKRVGRLRYYLGSPRVNKKARPGKRTASQLSISPLQKWYCNSRVQCAHFNFLVLSFRIQSSNLIFSKGHYEWAKIQAIFFE